MEYTYTQVYEFSRKEKDTDLQKLDDDFYNHLSSFFYSLKNQFDKEEDPVKQEELERLYKNAKQLINTIYKMREKKIIDLALNYYNTPRDIVSDSTLDNMLPCEKQFYNNFVSLLNNQCLNVFKDMFPESPKTI